MNEKQMKQIGGLFAEFIKQKDAQGVHVLNDQAQVDYRAKLIQELFSLENANDEMHEELRALSKFIRMKLWRDPYNTKQLWTVFHHIFSAFQVIADIADIPVIFNVDTIIEFVSLLAKYKNSYDPDIEDLDFERIIDRILKINQERIIREQWDDVLGSSDGMKTFMQVFDDVFTNAIHKYEDKFICSMTNDNVLSRCVKERVCNEDRFIPWPNKTNNRWNPPGKTFLYLAPKEQRVTGLPDGISGGQYICLLECRTDLGSDVCFCDFVANVPGRILDLSYNDIPMYEFRYLMMEEEQRATKMSLERLLSDPEVYAHKDDEGYIKNLIMEDIKKHPISEAVITESIAKQYLKSICSCIYQKVDDSDQVAKERAYKSFHILAEYLESKGITGIIYPSTRTTNLEGKNIVLFNIGDASPVTGSVVQFHYE